MAPLALTGCAANSESALTTAPTAPLTVQAEVEPERITPEFTPLVDHVRARATLWREGAPINSLVLDSRQTVLNPVAIDCQRREPVVIVDLDHATARPPLADGMKVAPGWPNTQMAIRAERVAIAWVTDMPTAETGAIRRHLSLSGLDVGGADPIAGRENADDRKQAIRQRLAARFCILAVVGDTRGDADEAYDYLRSADTALPIDTNWGAGWFLLPAPLSHAGAK